MVRQNEKCQLIRKQILSILEVFNKQTNKQINLDAVLNATSDRVTRWWKKSCPIFPKIVQKVAKSFLH